MGFDHVALPRRRPGPSSGRARGAGLAAMDPGLRRGDGAGGNVGSRLKCNTLRACCDVSSRAKTRDLTRVPQVPARLSALRDDKIACGKKYSSPIYGGGGAEGFGGGRYNAIDEYRPLTRSRRSSLASP